MTLNVHVFVVGEDDIQLLDDPPGAVAAGFENWRTTVWGSTATRSLGTRYFPLLAERDELTVKPDQIKDFQAECATVRANLHVVAPHPDPNRPQDSHEHTMNVVSERLANIETAAERALDVGGGVIIW